MSERRTLKGKKLLVASIGLATVSMTSGCFTSGNLVAPDGSFEEYDAGMDAGQDAGSDAGADAGTDAGQDAGTPDDGGP